MGRPKETKVKIHKYLTSYKIPLRYLDKNQNLKGHLLYHLKAGPFSYQDALEGD